jgi:hypothetical protein
MESQSLRTTGLTPTTSARCPCLYGKIEHRQGKSYPCPRGSISHQPFLRGRPEKLCERPEQGKISASLSGLSDFKVGSDRPTMGLLPTAGHAAMQPFRIGRTRTSNRHPQHNA